MRMIFGLNRSRGGLPWLFCYYEIRISNWLMKVICRYVAQATGLFLEPLCG